jgi:hypothetical protein
VAFRYSGSCSRTDFRRLHNGEVFAGGASYALRAMDDTRTQQLAHLTALAEELKAHGFATELTDKIRKPRLQVANTEQPQLNERVLCEQAEDGSWSFCWPWQQPIGSVDDLETVVGKVAAVLRSVEAET